MDIMRIWASTLSGMVGHHRVSSTGVTDYIYMAFLKEHSDFFSETSLWAGEKKRREGKKGVKSYHNHPKKRGGGLGSGGRGGMWPESLADGHRHHRREAGMWFIGRKWTGPGLSGREDSGPSQ